MLNRLTATYTGKPVVITGGEGHFGQALAGAVKAFGGRPISIDLGTACVRPEFYACDIRDAEALETVLDTIRHDHGEISFVIANAAIDMTGEAHQFSPDDWRSIIETNLIGTTNLIALTYPQMQALGAGDLLIVSSGSSLVSFPFGLPYTSSKAGQLALSLGLRSEAAQYGVNVSCVVLPGLTRDGETLSEVRADNRLGHNRTRFLNALPGRPYDMQRAALKSLQGLNKRKARIIFPGELAFSARLVGAMPWVGARIRDDIVSRFRKSAGRNAAD